MRKIALVLLFLFLLAPASALAGSGYEGGFYVNNDENSFRLTLSGRVQTKLYYDKTKGLSPTMTFALRRATLGVNATVAEKASLGFTLQHAQSSVANQTFATVQVAGATASVEIIPAFVITAGMVGLPLSFINEVSSKWLLTSEFPQVVTRDDTLTAITPLRSSFGTPDGLGLNFAGGYWKWFYSLSVVNGAESNYVVNQNSRRMSFGFRTGFNILDPVPGSLTDFDCSETPKLMVSIGSMYQGRRWDTTVQPNPALIKYLWTSSLGVALRWAGFSLSAEGFYRRTRILDLGSALWARPKLTDIGYYAAIGYYILPKKLEIAAMADQAIRQGPANDSWEFSGGLNYYIFDNNLKLQLDYTLSRFFQLDTTGTYTQSAKDHNITLMASAFF
jgi:hypothetical protein